MVSALKYMECDEKRDGDDGDDDGDGGGHLDGRKHHECNSWRGRRYGFVIHIANALMAGIAKIVIISIVVNAVRIMTMIMMMVINMIMMLAMVMVIQNVMMRTHFTQSEDARCSNRRR